MTIAVPAPGQLRARVRALAATRVAQRGRAVGKTGAAGAVVPTRESQRPMRGREAPVNDPSDTGTGDGDRRGQTAHRSLSVRLEELRRLVDTIASGDVRIPATLADVTVKRVVAEIEMLLRTDDDLEAFLRDTRNLPALHGSISRPAAVRELARRRLLSSHERIADAAERRRIKEC